MRAQISPWRRGILVGHLLAHCEVQGLCGVSLAKTADLSEMAFGVRTRGSPRHHILDGVGITQGEGEIWRAMRPGATIIVPAC